MFTPLAWPLRGQVVEKCFRITNYTQIKSTDCHMFSDQFLKALFILHPTHFAMKLSYKSPNIHMFLKYASLLTKMFPVVLSCDASHSSAALGLFHMIRSELIRLKCILTISGNNHHTHTLTWSLCLSAGRETPMAGQYLFT